MTRQISPQMGKYIPMVIAKIAIIIFATVIVFFQDLSVIFNEALKSETSSYVLVIPLLLTYMIYRKRRMIKTAASLEPSKLFKTIPLNEIVGTLLLFASISLYWYGSYTFNPLEYHMFALPIFASACILILVNTQTLRQLFFPIVFLFLLVPPPEDAIYNIGSVLSIYASELAFYAIKTLGIPAVLGSKYETPIVFLTRQDGTTVSFAIDIACSGIYSQISFLVFALFAVYLIRDKPWKKAATLALGFALMYMLNVFRIFIILIIGFYQGPALALTAFHFLGGSTLTFLGTLLLLVTSERLFSIRIFLRQKDECPECSRTRTIERSFCYTCGQIYRTLEGKHIERDLAKMAGLVLGIALVLYAQAPVLALEEGLARIILQTPGGEKQSTNILPYVPDYTLSFVYRDREFERIAKQDASLLYSYLPKTNSTETVWVAIEIASTKSSLHRWEACLIKYPILHGHQPRISEIELSDIQLNDNPPIWGRYFIFEHKKTNVTQAVLYWYETSIFKLNSTYEQKHVKISLVEFPGHSEDTSEVKSRLLVFAKRIVESWQPIQTWSEASLVLSQKGNILTASSVVLLAGVLSLYALENMKEKRQNTIAYSKLSTVNKLTIDIVHQTEKTALPVLGNIVKTYESITREKANEEEILNRLTDAEKTELLRSDIANRQDEPVKVWRTFFQ